MKHFNQFGRFFALVVLSLMVNLSAFASSNKTYYAKATATATGNGKVYVGTANTAPAEDAYQETAEATNSATATGNSTTVNLYLFAMTGSETTKFDGWYDNEECTGDALSTSNPCNVKITSNSTDKNAPVTKNYYAKFVEATEFYSSTLTVTAGEGGLVAVSAEKDNEDFGTSKSASVLNSVEPVQTYYLQAKPESDAYRFVGWYSDETCETQLSKNANYTYNVTAESLDEAEPTQFVAYAQFEVIPYYSSVLLVSAEGDGGVFVGLAANAEAEYDQESSASQKVADNTTHTYYLKAHANDADRAEFEGWFDGDSLLSVNPSYTYKVAVDAENANGDAEEFHVVAKFVNRNMYQVRNAGFEKWIAGNEVGFGWNSFQSASGSMASTGKGMSPNPEKVEGRSGNAVKLVSKFAGMLGIGANANGNLTTGTVNMGSMTPTDASNHNYTDVENADHHLLIIGQPDSVEFYSKYKMGDGEAHTGHAQFILHDAVNYIDPEVEEQVEHRIGASSINIEESEEWIRNVGTFDYEEAWGVEKADSASKYLLINFTTNVTPGGSKNDELILDDVRLIYNSEMLATVYGEDSLEFVDGVASVDALYDAEKALEVITNGRAAVVETSYDSKSAVLTITVKGQDIEENPENMHVYAIQFVKPTYALNFTIDGEAVGETKNLHEGDTIEAPEAPTKEGYTFAGWNEMPETMPAQNLTITGSYTVNSYVLTFVAGETTVKADSVAFGSAIVAPEDPTKEGYTFACWSEMPETMPAKDLTITASFTVNQYNLIFIVDGDTISSTKVAYGAEISAIEEPTSEGEKFSGWSSMPSTMPAKDVVVTGTFAANVYLLTYMVDGEIYQQFHVAYETELTAIDAPAAKEGYTFSGWSELPETMPAKDVTITGSFTINTYIISYYVNDVLVHSDSLEYGATVSPFGYEQQEGYTFSGWDEVPATMPAKDVKVSATETVNTYKVTYMVGDSVLATFDVNYGAEMPDAPEYTAESDDRYQRTFEGWNGETYETMPAKDVTYTAIVNVVDAIKGIAAEQNAKYYDLNGRRTVKAGKGLYIVNGKVVLKK